VNGHKIKFLIYSDKITNVCACVYLIC